MVEASRGLLEFLDHVEAPDREWLGNGDRLERLAWQVTLLGIVLASLVGLDEVPGISKGGRPVEVVPKSFPHEAPWRHVVPVDAAVDVEEQHPSILWGDAL